MSARGIMARIGCVMKLRFVEDGRMGVMLSIDQPRKLSR